MHPYCRLNAHKCLSCPPTSKMIDIAVLTLTDSHNGNQQIIVTHLINKAKPGRAELDL